MNCAVLQTDLEPPSAEQLQNAFRQVPELTAMDAAVLGKDAFGLLAKGFDLAQAAAMQSALAAQGVATEVVEEAALTELPPPKPLTKVEFTPEALQIADFMGRIVPLEWHDILVIAAGRARLVDFKQSFEKKFVTQGAGRHSNLRVVTHLETKEVQNDHWLLEIITGGAAQRYRAMADQPEATLLFQCLGERRGRDPAGNLTLFVQDLAKFAPAAVLNHGAFFMRENGDPSFSYPSQTAFYREITWLLWMISSGRAQRQRAVNNTNT
ncbi:MAG: hypothetical protein ABSG78_09185 [Verrucomicrobiota bacterium]|jgi:hypothetical protein